MVIVIYRRHRDIEEWKGGGGQRVQVTPQFEKWTTGFFSALCFSN